MLWMHLDKGTSAGDISTLMVLLDSWQSNQRLIVGMGIYSVKYDRFYIHNILLQAVKNTF